MAAKPSPAKDIIVMGRVIGPHGIKGWLNVKVFTETPDSLLDYSTWWLKTPAGWQECKVAEAEWRNTGLVARFEGHGDRTAVETLKGFEVGVPRTALPPLEEGEYYWADLIGLQVINTRSEPLGTIAGLTQTGANDVLVVHDKKDASSENVERLIPYIESVVVSVDLANRRLVVDWDLDY